MAGARLPKSNFLVFIQCSALFLIGWRVYTLICLGLGDDEAYYWDWHNHLDWSYFDHPGMVSWLVALSQAILPAQEWAVRLPFVLLLLVSGYFFTQLRRELIGDSSYWPAVFVFTFIPLYSLGGFLVVPDGPLVAAWLFVLWRLVKLKNDALKRSLSVREWVYIGLGVGLAVQSKLTAIILWPGVLIFILLNPQLRNELRRKGLWIGLVVSFIAVFPMLYWNFLHDFPGARFQLLERHSHHAWSLLRPMQFILVQLVLVSPFLIWLMVRKKFDLWKTPFVLAFVAPSFLVFFVQSIRAPFMIHWTAPLYLPLLAHFNFWPTADFIKFKINAIYLLAVNFLFLAMMTFPMLTWIGRYNQGEAWNPKNDISNDLYGWSAAAPWIVSQMDMVRQKTGQNPKLMATRYQLAGQLSFYTGHLASAVGPRANAYRLFADSPYKTDYSQSQTLFVADNRYTATPHDVAQFERCEELGQFEVFRFGVPARKFRSWWCTNLISIKN